VYLFLDANGIVQYVGKSINLRRRTANHFQGSPERLDSKKRRLMHLIREVRVFRTDTELMALLLEDALIKRHLPAYNVRQKRYQDLVFLSFSEDPFPRLLRQHGLDDEKGEPRFGPFPNDRHADRLEQFLGRYLGLRTCVEAHPTQKCLQADLKLCLAPCVSSEAGEAYQAVIPQVAAFLTGNGDRLIAKLLRSMEQAGRCENYEDAARLRDDLTFARNLSQRQGFIHNFGQLELCIREKVTRPCEYRFERGVLHAILRSGKPLQRDTAIIEAGLLEEPRFLLDRANLVYSWWRRNRMRAEYDFQLF